MKPVTQLFTTLSLALLLSACKSMPSSIWDTGKQPQEAQQPEPVAEQPKPQPRPSLTTLIKQDIAAYRLSKPKGNNAIEKIEQLRKEQPNSPAIAKYEKIIIDRYIELADKRIKRNNPPKRSDLETALTYINTARSLHVPSSALDKKEEVIIELLDIVVQQERLEKDREKSAPAATAPTTEVKPEPPVAETPKPEAAPSEPTATEQPVVNNDPNFLNLMQSQIDARSQEINLQLDSISSRIVSENAAVRIHAKSMDDFRYLSASLRTSLYWVDPDFVVTAEPHISDDVNPGIEIISY